jgi:hypothetical protein
VKPRHVLCFLGADNDLSRLIGAAEAVAQGFGFTVDREFSRAAADPQMQRSFGVCWDRVAPNAWTAADEEAVIHHQSVLYLVGPAMDQSKTVAYAAAALRIVEEMIDAGAVAVKGESAGVAHGIARWQQLAADCKASANTSQGLSLTAAMGRICRLAFTRRPLASGRDFESVGFHLVGLPEVYVSKDLGGEWDAVRVMDEVANDMAQRGIDAALEPRKLTVSHASRYAEDDFKFNPFGIVHVATQAGNDPRRRFRVVS